MPRKANVRANEMIAGFYNQGLTPAQTFKAMKAQRQNVPMSRISYYYTKLRKGNSVGSEAEILPVTYAPNVEHAPLATKIQFAKKILEANVLEEKLRVELVQKILA